MRIFETLFIVLFLFNSDNHHTDEIIDSMDSAEEKIKHHLVMFVKINNYKGYY